MPNPEKTYTKISAAVAILAAGLIFLPGLIHLDGMRGGYAISFVAFFIAVSAAVITCFFWGRAKTLDRILAGMDVLAHWTYQPEEWQRYADAELKEQSQENKWLWFVIAGWCLFFGILFWLLDREAGRMVFFMLLGLALFLACFAYGVPRLRYRRQRRKPGEAWIAPTAIYFDSALVPLNSWGSRLVAVAWRDAEGAVPAHLVFQVSVPSRAGSQEQTLRIPVPRGYEDEARNLLGHFPLDQ